MDIHEKITRCPSPPHPLHTQALNIRTKVSDAWARVQARHDDVLDMLYLAKRFAQAISDQLV